MPSDARILVVDDEPKICTMLEAALGRGHYTVHTCLDAAAALERFGTQPYDLVICDLRMPGVDGFELIRRLKGLRGDTIVLAVTGRATVDSAVQAIRHGADDYLTKPLEIHALRRIVDSSLANRQLLAHAHDAAAAAEATPASHPPAPAPGSPSAAHEVLEANISLERRVAELVATQEVAQTVAAELHLDRLLETSLGAIRGATGARVVSILLLDPREGCLVVRARHGRNGTRAVGERRRIGEGVAGWVAQHRVPLLIPDVDEQPAFRSLARGEGYHTGSFVAVPLLVGERLLGVLCAADRGDGGSFDERDLRLMLGAAPHVAIAIENAQLHETIQHNAYRALRALAESFEARDGYARGHAARVADAAARTAQQLGLSADEIHTLRQAAHLHDIGKLAVSDTILSRPGQLTDDERATVQEHPVRGARVLATTGFLQAICPVVRHHHERWDGGGYPDGLAGRAIDPLTRVLSVADAYDAMISPRPHRQARSRDEALAELARCAGSQFDPGLIEPFARAVAGVS